MMDLVPLISSSWFTARGLSPPLKVALERVPSMSSIAIESRLNAGGVGGRNSTFERLY